VRLKIVLLGFMGSGKSTIGKLLSESLEVPFFDLDVGMTIQYTSEKSEGYNSTFFFYANDITFMRSHRTEEFQVTAKLSALEF
jgi:shikimate kinase